MYENMSSRKYYGDGNDYYKFDDKFIQNEWLESELPRYDSTLDLSEILNILQYNVSQNQESVTKLDKINIFSHQITFYVNYLLLLSSVREGSPPLSDII